MALTGDLLRQLHAALLDAYPTSNALSRMVSFELDERLSNIANEQSPLSEIVFDLLLWAEARGRTAALVEGASRQNPGNPKLLEFREQFLHLQQQHPVDADLRRFAEQISLAPAPPSKAALERIVVRSARFQDVAEWRAKLGQAELAVCQVRLRDRPAGTGFLVGPDIAITNSHVLPGLIDGATAPGDVTLVFDFKLGSDGRELTKQPYGLAEEWLVAASSPGELDFVLLRVDGKPGQGPVGGTAGAPPRGWLTPVRRNLEAGEPILILQHPLGAPMKLAVGAFVQATPTRLTYNTNTEAGSSGSPCFDSDFQLVALHRGHRDINEGIPFGPILDATPYALAQAFVPPPPSLAPAVTPFVNQDADSSSVRKRLRDEVEAEFRTRYGLPPAGAAPAAVPPTQPAAPNGPSTHEIHAEFRLERGTPLYDTALDGWKLRLFLVPTPGDAATLVTYTLRDLYGPDQHQTLDSSWAKKFRTQEFTCKIDVAITADLRTVSASLAPAQSFLAEALRRHYGSSPGPAVTSAIATIAQNWT